MIYFIRLFYHWFRVVQEVYFCVLETRQNKNMTQDKDLKDTRDFF